jgi:hypothetical protein
LTGARRCAGRAARSAPGGFVYRAWKAPRVGDLGGVDMDRALHRTPSAGSLYGFNAVRPRSRELRAGRSGMGL